MSRVLEDICARRRERVAEAKNITPLALLREQAAAQPPARPFFAALSRTVETSGIGLIAEIKKASPSHGLIRAEFEPGEIAKTYESAGASCLSVLTEPDYFQGAPEHLASARHHSALPVLRKDFIVDAYQVAESRAMGADCVLIIVAALDNMLMQDLESEAMALGMSVLVEVHDETELERAQRYLSSPLLGINHRNLSTLKVDLSTSARLAPMAPPGALLVAESGIRSASEIAQIRREANIHCFLVGESLLSHADLAQATRALLAHP